MPLCPCDGEPRTAGAMPLWHNRQASGGTAQAPESAASAAGRRSDSEGKFGFFDLLDIVNPLQHLPIVSYIYREITDDRIKPVSQIAGGGLYGGLLGAAASGVNVIVEQETGKDIPGNLVSLVTGEEEGPSPSSAPPAEPTALALVPEPVTAEPLADLSLPSSASAAVHRTPDAPVKASSFPPQTAAVDLPGTVVALADLRKSAMRSFILNT